MVKNMKKRASPAPAETVVAETPAVTVVEPALKKRKVRGKGKKSASAAEKPGEEVEQEEGPAEEAPEQPLAAETEVIPTPAPFAAETEVIPTPAPLAAETEALPKKSSQCATDLSFEKLGLHENLLKGLLDAGFTKMFEIQARSVPHLLAGEDVLGAAKTGSGKTLAFLVPMIDTLVKTKFLQKNGTGVLVIAPTRELVHLVQIFNLICLVKT